MQNTREKLFGIVEGFYGVPWNARQRHRLFGWCKAAGLNTFLYAPKDDLKHRAIWRELYDEAQASELAALVRDAQRHGLRFIYAISPGLDIRYADPAETGTLIDKLLQLRGLGVRDFAVLFDDIPTGLQPGDLGGLQELAAAQAGIANTVFSQLALNPGERFLFCPVEYCGRFANPSVADSPYLKTIGQQLHQGIDILWTGPEIISGELDSEGLLEIEAILKRKPLIWDNLYANDYDTRRLYLGPYLGRDESIRTRVSGVLVNPNCQFEANFPAIASFGDFVRGEAETNRRELHAKSIAQWLPQFATVGGAAFDERDMALLVDLFHLPFEHGALTKQALVALDSMDVECLTRFADGVRGLQEKATRLTNRDLAAAFYRHLWDAKEECELLIAIANWSKAGNRGSFHDARFRPKLFRGGLLGDLAQRIVQNPDGSFTIQPQN